MSESDSARSPDFESRFAEAYHLIEAGCYGAALEVLSSLRADCPDEALVWGMTGFVYRFLEDDASALPFLVRATELDPAREAFSTSLFRVLWNLDRHKAALLELQRFWAYGSCYEHEATIWDLATAQFGPKSKTLETVALLDLLIERAD